jgi:hypothetical protein
MEEYRNIQIVDALGRIVYKHTLFPGVPDLTLSVSSWNKGVYVVQVVANDKISTSKIIVK